MNPWKEINDMNADEDYKGKRKSVEHRYKDASI